MKTKGNLPAVGSKAPDFRLTNNSLEDITLANFSGKKVLLNIFPSIDTGTCAASVRRFNKLAADLDNVVVICVSKDLPFAQRRFCGAEGIENVITASEYKDKSFSEAYGVEIAESPMIGLMYRCVVAIDEAGQVLYTEKVAELGNEPDYDKAMHAIM